MMFKEMAIEAIRRHWYYEPGELEAMPEEKIREIWNSLCEWLGD